MQAAAPQESSAGPGLPSNAGLGWVSAVLIAQPCALAVCAQVGPAAVHHAWPLAPVLLPVSPEPSWGTDIQTAISCFCLKRKGGAEHTTTPA